MKRIVLLRSRVIAGCGETVASYQQHQANRDAAAVGTGGWRGGSPVPVSRGWRATSIAGRHSHSAAPWMRRPLVARVSTGGSTGSSGTGGRTTGIPPQVQRGCQPCQGGALGHRRRRCCFSGSAGPGGSSSRTPAAQLGRGTSGTAAQQACTGANPSSNVGMASSGRKSCRSQRAFH